MAKKADIGVEPTYAPDDSISRDEIPFGFLIGMGLSMLSLIGVC